MAGPLPHERIAVERLAVWFCGLREGTQVNETDRSYAESAYEAMQPVTDNEVGGRATEPVPSPGVRAELPAEACDECVRLGQACAEHRPSAGETDQRTHEWTIYVCDECGQDPPVPCGSGRCERIEVVPKSELNRLHEINHDGDHLAGDLAAKLGEAERERDEAREALRPFVREYERNGYEYVPDTLILDNFDKACEALRAAGSEEENRNG